MFLDVVKQNGRQVSNFNEICEAATDSEFNHLESLLPEFYKFLGILATIPVTSCSSERSFSDLRRLKSYLRSTMSQKRLNNVAILHCHTDRLYGLHLSSIADEFIQRNTVRRNTFALSN